MADLQRKRLLSAGETRTPGADAVIRLEIEVVGSARPGEQLDHDAVAAAGALAKQEAALAELGRRLEERREEFERRADALDAHERELAERELRVDASAAGATDLVAHEERLEDAERALEAGLSALELRQQRLSQLERENRERTLELEARDAALEQRAVELEVAFELREDRAESRESELAAREQRLERRQAELADYVAQLQAGLR